MAQDDAKAPKTLATGKKTPDDDPAGNDIFPSTGRNVRRVRLDRTELQNVDAAPLWLVILKHTELIGFDRYVRFINKVLCERWQYEGPDDSQPPDSGPAFRRLTGLDPYQLLRLATQVFLLTRVGAWRPDKLASGEARSI